MIQYFVMYKYIPHVVVISSGVPESSAEQYGHIKTLNSMEVIIVCAGSNDGDVDPNNIAYPAR